MEVIVVLEVNDLTEKEKFEKYLKKEGFNSVENEEFVYTGTSTTTIFSTKAYILGVFKEALELVTFDKCKMIFQIAENPFEAYVFDRTTNDFEKQSLK